MVVDLVTVVVTITGKQKARSNAGFFLTSVA
jgi:hypothetical protein